MIIERIRTSLNIDIFIWDFYDKQCSVHLFKTVVSKSTNLKQPLLMSVVSLLNVNKAYELSLPKSTLIYFISGLYTFTVVCSTVGLTRSLRLLYANEKKSCLDDPRNKTWNWGR